MLNKIKIVGRVLPIEVKEREKEGRNEPIFYFSLLVPNPSSSLTILRCVAYKEVAKAIEEEINQDEVIEIKGYLRNERASRQVLIKVVEFTKLDITAEEIDSNNSNQLRLLGKIVTDFKVRQNEITPEVISFRLAVQREGNPSPLFFCRVQGEELITQVSNKLKKGDIILLEGYLQTKKIEELTEEGEKKFSRISSIICQAFTFIDSDLVSVFNPLDKFSRITGKVEKIDFTKPKEKLTEE